MDKTAKTAGHVQYKILVSFLFGVIGAVINLYPVNLRVPPFTASLVMGLTFPMLISLIWGWKYALVALFAGFGGQTMWFLWVPHNGWAPFVAIPVYNLWVLWHGCRFGKRVGNHFPNFYIAEIPFRLFNTLVIFTLFAWSFRFNPSPWAPEMVQTQAVPVFLGFIAVKQAVEGIMILLLADVLLNFNFFRKVLLIQRERDVNTGYIIRGALLFGLILWLVSALADYLFFESKRDFIMVHSRPSFTDSVILNVPPYEIFTRILFLLICLTAGLAISKYVRKYNERTKDLADSEERYRDLVELMNDGIAVVDRGGGLVYANSSMQDMLGYTMDELAGRRVPSFLDGKNAAVLAGNLESIAEGESCVFELEWKRRDGDWGLYVVSARTLSYREERNNGFFAVVSDITQKRRAEKEKERLEEQLRQSQKMEAIGRLTGGIAHDFNNILTSIIGYCDLIAMETAEGDPVHEMIDVIRSSGISAGKLTRQLLAFSRKQVVELKPIDLNRIISNHIHMLDRVIGENITLDFRSDLSSAMILGDCTQIEQVILNLVVNARDAMPGGGSLNIETHRLDLDEASDKVIGGDLPPGPYVVMAVSDTGCGIPGDILEKIFDPFFTTKEMGKGTGLGLSTVYGIIKQHHGGVSVLSEKGQGTCFRVLFPRLEAGSKGADEEVSEGDFSPFGGNERLLVVDDYPEIIELLTRLLSSLGYDLVTAGSAEEAMAIAEGGDRAFDLLLTDVIMTGENGMVLSHKLEELIPGIKVLYMSGYTGDVISEDVLFEIGNNFINKPLLPSCVIRKIREVLDGE